MRPTGLLSKVFVTAAALLLLGGLGAYWPALVGANTARSTGSPGAMIGDAITYQGYLTDADAKPLSGTFTMRFVIFNDPIAGTALWDSGNLVVNVEKGLFSVRLPIETDIFNGEELWLSQVVNGETLTPRQEILPAPIAHTLRPGAIIKGTANALPNNYLLDVQMNNDSFAFNRGAISGQSTTGNAIYGLAESGRAVYGQTEDGYAIYGFDGGSNANRGYGGYFYSTNGIGVYGYSNGDRSHPNILAPGVYGQSNRGVGVYGRGDTSNSSTFYNEGGRFEGGSGIYARGTDNNGYGAEIFGVEYRGMFVQGDTGSYDAYFGSGAGISASNVVDRGGAAQSLAVNLGSSSIEPGDLVGIVGIATSPESGQPMLGVARLDAANYSAVIGVAKEAMKDEAIALEDGSAYIDFSPSAGSIAPNGYLVIITSGLAPAVNISSLALVTDWQIGEKLTIAAGGEMQRSGDGVAGVTVGRVAGPVDEARGTIPMFINID